MNLTEYHFPCMGYINRQNRIGDIYESLAELQTTTLEKIICHVFPPGILCSIS